MTGIIVMKTSGPGMPEAEHDVVDPAKTLSGGPVNTTTWNHWTGEDDRLLCGIWECEPGKMAMEYEEWEFCHFIEGEAILTNDKGESWTLKAGDGFIIPAGFKGTWETVKKVRKHYVILLPKG